MNKIKNWKELKIGKQLKIEKIGKKLKIYLIWKMSYLECGS